VLVDKQKGVIHRSREFSGNKYSSLVMQEAASHSKMVDILKVHDFTYIQRMITQIQKLQHTGNKIIAHLD
jgi:hypothetical protein